MEKQVNLNDYVDYSIASEIKELGFDVEVDSYFIERSQQPLMSKRLYNFNDRWKGMASRPTYKQIIVWMVTNKGVLFEMGLSVRESVKSGLKQIYR